MSDAANSAEGGSASLTNDNDNYGSDGAGSWSSRTRSNNFYTNQSFSAARRTELGKFELFSPADQAGAVAQYDKTLEMILNHVASDTTNFKHVGRLLLEGFQAGKMPEVSVDPEPTPPDRRAAKYEMQVATTGGKTQTEVDRELFNCDFELFKINHEEWQYERAKNEKIKAALEDGIPNMSRMFVNQCSDQLLSAVKQQVEWRDVKNMKSPVELGALIRRVMLGFTNAVEPNLQALLIMRLYLTLFQGPTHGLLKYDELYWGMITLMREINNGELPVPFSLVLEELRKDHPAIVKQYDDCADKTFDPFVSKAT